MGSKTDKPVLTAGFFVNNRTRLRQLFGGTAPIVITGNGQMQRSADHAFPFQQDSNFWYLTGVDQPGVVLVIDGEKEYLIVPKQDDKQSIFEGDIDIEKMLVVSGVSEIIIGNDGWRRLEKRLKRVKHVATLEPAPAHISALNFYTNPARADLIERLGQINSKLTTIDLRPHFSRLRQIKTEAELEVMEYAVNNTARLFKQIKKRLANYKNEQEILADTLSFATINGFGLAYEPIVAGGKNALTLHYTQNNQKLGTRQPVLLDIGLSYQGYNADITRVYSANPTKRQKQVHDRVIDIQNYALSLLEPGVSMADYEKKVAYYAGEKLRELGLISTISSEEVGQFYPHSTSHFLGIDVHDAGDYTRPLEPGMVLTVEPGIYIKEEGLGIRVEDDVVITDKGSRVLSTKLLRDLA